MPLMKQDNNIFGDILLVKGIAVLIRSFSIFLMLRVYLRGPNAMRKTDRKTRNVTDTKYLET